jgi:translation initiation factor IF-3
VNLDVALAKARDEGVDLVEISPTARPPVCRIMDYGKFKFEEEKKAKEARRNNPTVKLKEIKLRPRTEEHDFTTKLRQIRDFLTEGHRVKVTIVYQGRELAHRDIGQKQLQDMTNETKDLGTVEQAPRSEGRTLFLVLGPSRKPVSG